MITLQYEKVSSISITPMLGNLSVSALAGPFISGRQLSS